MRYKAEIDMKSNSDKKSWLWDKKSNYLLKSHNCDIKLKIDIKSWNQSWNYEINVEIDRKTIFEKNWLRYKVKFWDKE